jgi:hypothetical protein
MSKPCAFPDCPSPAVAKGLCAKHNMRLRRHGDPAKVNARGRRDGDAAARAFLRDISDRSFARYMRALRLLHRLGLDVEPFILRATRPNGSMNCALLEELAESAAAIHIARLPE